MRLPKPELWNAGTKVNAELFNEIQYTIAFLLDPPGCVLAQTTTQSISHNTWTPISFTTKVEDSEYDADSTNPMWSVSTPTEIVIRTDGWYAFELAPAFKGSTGGDVNTKRDVALSVNGTRVAQKDFSSRGTLTVQYKGWDEYFLNVGDIVKMEVYQNRGSSLGTATPADVGETYSTIFRMKWVSL